MCFNSANDNNNHNQVERLSTALSHIITYLGYFDVVRRMVYGIIYHISDTTIPLLLLLL